MRGSQAQSPGAVMTVLTRAMRTNIVNAFSGMKPRSKPTFSTSTRRTRSPYRAA